MRHVPQARPVPGFPARERPARRGPARVTLYERAATSSSWSTSAQGGLGRLYEAFEKLKTRLAEEGLFEPGRKKALARFPRAIGLVTSPSAAALRDVVTTLRRRAPMIPLVLYPTLVQGEGAASQIARAIQRANAHGACDVLIVCRGGGSLEDLWAYNEEVVARAIFASRLPVVSGVGHETDFTIADFVADLRAATPTAAAVAASPDGEGLRSEIEAGRRRLSRAMRRVVEVRMQRLDSAARRLLTPTERIERQRERLAQSRRRLQRALDGDLRHGRQRLAALRTALAHLDPTQVLARGYSIVRGPDGHVRRTSAGLSVGDPLDVTFSEGGALVRVEKPR
jgi:exodeoxyribonuclease VII large subunit